MYKNSFIEFSTKAPNPNIPSVCDITTDELAQKMGQVRVIDVRRADEWVGEFGHIPNAQLVTLDTLANRIHELPENLTIVFVCRSGGRSAQATVLALSHGLKNVYNMRGGMIEWTQKKFATTERSDS